MKHWTIARLVPRDRREPDAPVLDGPGTPWATSPGWFIREHWRRLRTAFGVKLVKVEVSVETARSPTAELEPKPSKRPSARRQAPRNPPGEDRGAPGGSPESRPIRRPGQPHEAPPREYSGSPARPERPGMPLEQAARVRAAEDRIEAELAPARTRYAAADPGSRALRPAELDWTTPDERARLEEAQQALRDALGAWDSPEAARERVRAKREATKATAGTRTTRMAPTLVDRVVAALRREGTATASVIARAIGPPRRGSSCGTATSGASPSPRPSTPSTATWTRIALAAPKKASDYGLLRLRYAFRG